MNDFDLLRDHKRISLYGGSFDPLHLGHLAVADALLSQFSLDVFVLVPAFHAPHKRRKMPTPALDRYAMACLATNERPSLIVSKMEIDVPERPYSVQTLQRLVAELPASEIFFVIGADSWMDITTWHRWEEVLSLTSHIVVTRPGFEISFAHVTPAIRERIIDLRGKAAFPSNAVGSGIFISDAVNIDISATRVRDKIREGDISWKADVPEEVAKYIEKYQIYD